MIFETLFNRALRALRALIVFGGLGGPEIALHEAGIETVSIEKDDAIAEVSRYNGNNCLTADILDVDPANYVGYWLYHFSPPCPSFSIANQASSETALDIALARKICQFIRIGRPEFFTLENVWLYRKSKSWKIILEALRRAGYGVGWWHLNAADYGVPQTRKRMIVIARRDGRQPAKPWQTHSGTGDMFTRPWVGWYEAIEDLIPDLPESQFADWQLAKMPDKLGTVLIPGDNTSNKTIRPAGEPMVTVQTRPLSQCPHRAFIFDSQNASSCTIRQSSEPMITVTANGLETGRVVAMTPRCLARFQGFPDWFQLPENRALACRGIGNALPPGMYRAVLKTLTKRKNSEAATNDN